MKIKIVTIGKTTLKTLSPLIDDYCRRLQSRFSLEMKNFKSVDLFLKTMREKIFLIVLDAKGTHFTSEHFAKWLEDKCHSQKNLTFLIGPAEGLPESIKVQASFGLSLSPLTLQHELALVVLLEQLYRASTILKGEPYHK